MVKDSETNILYLSELLKTNPKYSSFYSKLSQILKKNNISVELLKGTKDIWAKDYMPIQVRPDRFIQFVYDPDYLYPKEYRKYKTDPDEVLSHLSIKPFKSKILIDGGNVVKAVDKVILTDKVYTENYSGWVSDMKKIPESFKNGIRKKLRDLFEKAEIIIIPRLPGDYIGHSDGIVRFLDNKTVLIFNPDPN